METRVARNLRELFEFQVDALGELAKLKAKFGDEQGEDQFVSRWHGAARVSYAQSVNAEEKVKNEKLINYLLKHVEREGLKMSIFLNLWYYLVYGVPYHEHRWHPAGLSLWVCNYESPSGRQCSAKEYDHVFM